MEQNKTEVNHRKITIQWDKAEHNCNHSTHMYLLFSLTYRSGREPHYGESREKQLGGAKGYCGQKRNK